MNIHEHIHGLYYNFIDKFSMAPNIITMNPAMFMNIKNEYESLTGMITMQSGKQFYMGMRVIRSHDLTIDEIIVSHYDPIK